MDAAATDAARVALVNEYDLVAVAERLAADGSLVILQNIAADLAKQWAGMNG